MNETLLEYLSIVRQKTSKEPAKKSRRGEEIRKETQRAEGRKGSTKEPPTRKIYFNSKKLKATVRRMIKKAEKEV
jgi:hypothetical protein